MKLISMRTLMPAALLVAALSACASEGASPSTPEAGAQLASGDRAAPDNVEERAGADASETGSTVAGPSGPSTPPETSGAGGGQGGDEAKSTKEKTGLRPLKLPFEPELDVRATVSPSCVSPGGRLTLVVTTAPDASIAYQAVYSGNQGGAPKPFGAGYGGNAKGFAGADGTYRSAWTVAADAPEGEGRVDVIVGHDGKWGYDDPGFRVGGTC